jgi:glycosidase
VNPELGSAVDLLNLIRKAHELDIRVVLDFVPNHVAPDYQYLKKQPHLVTRDKNGTPVRKVADWTDIVDLDYSQHETYRHISEVMQYWIREFDVDGYRCDVAGLVPSDFWEMVMPHLKAIKPELYMLAEWEAPGLHKEVFHSTYDWTLYSLMMQVHDNKTPVYILSDWLDLKARSYPKNACPLRFLENHDKPRSVTIFKEKSIIPYLVLLYTIDGIPLVYNGQEIGTSAYSSLFEREPIDWNHNNLGMYKLLKILIALRKRYHALAAKNYTFTPHNQEEDVLAYVKLGREKVFTIINFREKELEVNLPSLIYSRVKTGRVLFNSKSHFQLGLNRIRMMPYQAILVLIR